MPEDTPEATNVAEEAETEGRDMSREERVTGKAPADESPAGLDPDSREAHVSSGEGE